MFNTIILLIAWFEITLGLLAIHPGLAFIFNGIVLWSYVQYEN